MALDPNTPALLVIGAGVVSINCKIVWDWFKNRRNGTNGLPPGCSARHSEIDGHLRVIDERIDANAKALAKGDKKFAHISEVLGDMDGNIKVLLDRSQRRRATDDD